MPDRTGDVLNVLIVEDEALIALDLEAQVCDAGHTVVAIAATAERAVTCAEETRPDVALMDMRLANGSCGADAARTLFDVWGIRCIFISGNLEPAVQATLAGLQPFAMLSKPIMPAQLLAALGCACREIAARGQAASCPPTPCT